MKRILVSMLWFTAGLALGLGLVLVDIGMGVSMLDLLVDMSVDLPSHHSLRCAQGGETEVVYREGGKSNAMLVVVRECSTGCFISYTSERGRIGPSDMNVDCPGQ